MTSEQFAYWLQGYAELSDAPPTADQWKSIHSHLALVFTKVTPLIHPIDRAESFSVQVSDKPFINRNLC